MNQGHQALLKEVYEKRRKVELDGKNVDSVAKGNVPPWLQKAKNSTPDEKKTARAAAIQKRLANKVPAQKGK